MASAIYTIYSSPEIQSSPDLLPSLLITPHGRPSHVLYSFIHSNSNTENYLLTPSEQGDLCVAKLFPPSKARTSASSSSSHGNLSPGGNAVRCEASRNLKWSISNTGIQNPVYKLTLPNPDVPQQDQPLFQVSKPNPHATWWTLFYFTYAGHLIPPKRVEFGRIQKNTAEGGGGTRVTITGKSEEEKAVWKTLGEGNEDMVEWVVLSAALTVVDDEIIVAAEKAGLGLNAGPERVMGRPSPGPTREPQQQPYHVQPNAVPHPNSSQNGNGNGNGNGYGPPQQQRMAPPPAPRADPRARSPIPPSQQLSRPEAMRSNSENSYSDSRQDRPPPDPRQERPQIDPRQERQQPDPRSRQAIRPDPRQPPQADPRQQVDPRQQQQDPRDPRNRPQPDPRQDPRNQPYPNPPPRNGGGGGGMDPRDPRYPQWVAQQQQQQMERDRYESQQRNQNQNQNTYGPPPPNLNSREGGNRLQRNR